jgi:hypothetical protein
MITEGLMLKNLLLSSFILMGLVIHPNGMVADPTRDDDQPLQQSVVPTIVWKISLGSADFPDEISDMTVDSDGNTYIIGESSREWGNPIIPFDEDKFGSSIFIAKLDTNGILLWNTFLGLDRRYGSTRIAVDERGNTYLAISVNESWGDPIKAYMGMSDAFIAKLNPSGELQWNTFLGSTGYDFSSGIAVDGDMNIYILGVSDSTWGNPVNPQTPGSTDFFVAKLNNAGFVQWNTFLGGSEADFSDEIKIDRNGNIYVEGHSRSTWGTPISAFSEDNFGYFIALLDNSGDLQWNTFLNSPLMKIVMINSYEMGGNNDLYLGGVGLTTITGTPIADVCGVDGIIAQADEMGTVVWNTFLGSTGLDGIYELAVDKDGNIYGIGYSDPTCGGILGTDISEKGTFIVQTDNNGALQWKYVYYEETENNDLENALLLNIDKWGYLYIGGNTDEEDAFVVKLNVQTPLEPTHTATPSISQPEPTRTLKPSATPSPSQIRSTATSNQSATPPASHPELMATSTPITGSPIKIPCLGTILPLAMVISIFVQRVTKKRVKNNEKKKSSS